MASSTSSAAAEHKERMSEVAMLQDVRASLEAMSAMCETIEQDLSVLAYNYRDLKDVNAKWRSVLQSTPSTLDRRR
ncbi:hypothetical protein CAOG_009689 [Capsaspora owczarzaki ATCC 30864]|uniref:Uncharacterized protein n=1 Tax=Capsaspora owczarzaki (strain ATCC 30864) TaxID=595528 RepID=A0A0D2VQ37_CAPO3|nr:hypothetical protein CAOG_009689 [Capsaspora owczarzaki ATCC 30864]